MVTDKDLLVVQQHTIDGLDSSVGGLAGLVVNETITSRVAVLIDCNLAGEDVTKRGKGVVEGLVVNRLIEVLDENITLRALPQRRVPLSLHDTTSASLDQRVVQRVESTFTVSSVEVVDVGVTERSTSDGITTDSDGSDGTDHVEDLEKHGLGDARVELANVEGSGSGSRVGSSGRGLSRGGGSL
jgi:hypothetical protein